MYQSVSAAEAVKSINSGDKVWIQAAAAVPEALVRALSNRGNELKGVKIYQLHTEGEAPYAKEELCDAFEVNAMFVGANVRQCINSGRGNFIPMFLSEVPIFFRRGWIPLDVALVHVSPPDKHGFCSLGISVEATKAAIDCAKHVIAQVNPNMPRTHGDGIIHISKFDTFVEVEEPIFELPPHESSEIDKQIGRNVAELIEDRACLQMGIGSIPNAVLANLGNHKDLGIHTEMFSDGVIELCEKGVITGKYKRKHKDTLVTGFLMGSRKLYDFVDDNPEVRLLDIQYVNNSSVIMQNPKVVSINSAIEVDLTGQVCADSIGTRIYSGVGGQMDFIRGATLSEGGKPIIALPSTTAKGISRICPVLKSGAGVVTTRAHVHYVITEYGVASLFGRSLKERARQLINVAHPGHREELEKTAHERFGRHFV